jgi:secreted trypsin-like serine protease
MFKRSFLLPLLPAALLISACTGSNNSLTKAAGETIVNGQELIEMTDARSSTVLIYRETEGADGQKAGSICTGTLVAEDMILTAAHCAPRKTDGKSFMFIGFGNNIDDSFTAKRKTPIGLVAEYRVNTQWDETTTSLLNSPNDLAILRFEGTLPEGFKIRPLPSEDYKIDSKGTIEMIGFGLTVEKGNDSGILRHTEVPATKVAEGVYIPKYKQYVPVPGTIIMNQQETGVCSGDSGGPLFAKVNGTVTMVGVTSMVADMSENEVKRACHGISVFVDLRAQLKWVQDTMAELALAKQLKN